MYFNNNFPESFFRKGHNTLTWGAVLLGSVLFFLAIFIFAYPALIAYFIAAIILFAGCSTLAIGWKLWQFRDAINKLEGLEGEYVIHRKYNTDHSH